jgi:hypothetical protein
MLRAIVALVCLRGREQPSVWIATRLTGPDVVMPGTRILVVRSEVLGAVVAGRLCDEQVCAVVAQALGGQPVSPYKTVLSLDREVMDLILATLADENGSH